LSKKLYVGNLQFATSLEQLKSFFAGFNILSAKIVLDKETQKPKGFGFVEIGDENGGAVAAVVALNGKELNGRTIRVNPAIDKPRTSETRSSTKNTADTRSPSQPLTVSAPIAEDDFGWKQPTLSLARRR
jgi:RNA recognition motif-containing protein